MTKSELSERIESIEESYEFFLAYAAQGAAGEAAARQDAQVRQFLERANEALGALEHGLFEMIDVEKLEPAGPYREMASVVMRDARDARAAVRLVLAQAAISSQLIDNLNASTHVRAVLTDLFLLDEALSEGAA
jgi:hypothetical protein